MIVDLANSKVYCHKNKPEIEMVFFLKSNEISPENLIKLDAGNGDFFIGAAGGTPEFPFIFFYGDDHDQFFFSGIVKKLSEKEKAYAIEINWATQKKGAGAYFKTSSDRVFTIEKNINYAFINRSFILLNKSIEKKDAPAEIYFIWNISK